MTMLAAPLDAEEEAGALAAPELALVVLVVVGDAVELALAAEAEEEAADMDIEEEDMDIDIELDMDDPLPVIDIAPDPVNVPSPILLVVTTAVLESELLYHG